MATTPKNSPWHEKRNVKKGDYGEDLVEKFFEDNGYIIYKPVTDGAHGFDRLLYKNERYIALEVKTKPACRKYPETGFAERLYDRYLKLSNENNLPVIIAFVDENEGAIYYNYLAELTKPFFDKELGEQHGHYPKRTTHTGGTNPTVYFSRKSMENLRNLSDAEVEELKRRSSWHE